MVTFGGYETISELPRGGHAVVHLAKAADGSRGEFVVKVLHPHALVEDEDRAETAVSNFLDAAKVQRDVAAMRGSHWAPVHEFGEAYGLAYCVYDRYPWSIQNLIRGHIRLDATRLYRIVEAVLEGLIELQSAFRRPHGWLRPSNILLKGSSLTRAQVVLTDPAPADRLDPKGGTAQDLRAVGELIYQLVLHQPVPTRGGVFVPESSSWDALGKRRGGRWRDLCNRLLAEGEAPRGLTPEEVRKELAPLKTSAALKRAAILAFVVLVLAGAGAWGTSYAIRLLKAPPVEPFNAQEWQEVCDAFQNYRVSLDRLAKDREVLVPAATEGAAGGPLAAKLAGLREVLDRIAEGQVELDPRKIAGSDMYIPNMRASPPDGAKMPEAIAKTTQALEAVGTVQNVVEAFRKELRLLAASEYPPGGPWKDVGHWFETAAAGLDLRNKQVGDLLRMAVRVEAYGRSLRKLQPKVESIPADQPQRRKCQDLADTARASLLALLTAGEEGSQAFDKQAEKVAADLKRLSINLIKSPGEWLGEIARLSQPTSSAVLNAEWARRRDDLLASFLAEARQRRGVGGGLEQARRDWQQDRPGALADIGTSLKDDAEGDSRLRERVDQMVGALVKLDELPRELHGATGEQAGIGWFRTLAEMLQAEREKVLGEALEALKEAAGDGALSLDLFGGPFAERWKDLAGRYDALRNSLSELARGFLAIQSALDLCYLIDETDPPKLPQSVRSLYESCRSLPALGDQKVLDALKGLTDRLDAQLKLIEPGDDLRRRLADGLASTATAKDFAPEIARAAWRGLGEFTGGQSWPDTDAEAETEEKASRRMGEFYASLADGPRRTLLQQELVASGLRLKGCRLAAQIRGNLDILRPINAAQADGFSRQLEDLRSRPASSGTLEDLSKLDAQILLLIKDPRDALREKLVAARAAIQALAQLNDRAGVQAMGDRLKQIESGVAWGLSWDDRANRPKIIEQMRPSLQAIQDVLKAVSARSDALARLGRLSDPSALPMANAEWSRRRDALLARDALVDKPDKLLAAAETVHAFLASLDQAFPPPSAGKLPAELAEAVEAFAVSRRQTSLKKALATLSDTPEGIAADAKAFESLRAEYAAWQGGISPAIAALSRIQALLNEAYGLDEKPADGGATVAAIYAQWVGAKEAGKWQAWKDLVQIPALGAVAHRVDDLQLVARMDRDKLLTAARVDDLAVRLNAWRRLGASGGAPWPGTAGDLETEQKLQVGLAEALRSAALSEPRKSSLLEELKAQARLRSVTCMNRLSDAASVEKVVTAARRLGVSFDPAGAGSALGDLKPTARLNCLLYALTRQDVRQLDDEKVRQAIAGFDQAVRTNCPDLVRSPAVADLLGEMDKIRQFQQKTGDLGKAGPGKATFAAWTAQADPKGKFVTFTWSDRKRSLDFVRIEPTAQGAETIYLCLTECSAGLFLDAVAGADKWAEIAKLLPAREYAETGPQVWMWDRAGDRIRLAREWLVKLPGVTELYPQGMDPGAPSADHPLQRVTPAAADAFAALLGCRLPSPGEWLAAYAQYAGERPLSRWNLRDAAWAAQKQHVQKQWEQGRQMDYPDAGIFWPEEIKPEDRKTGEKAVVADENDGILWFAPVDSDKDRTLHHLVGNVAELVREPSGGCYVVGTSALSPPEVKPDHPYPLGDRQAAQGFSDVGFRLAFKAPIDPLGAQLDRLLTGRNLYLPPGD